MLAEALLKQMNAIEHPEAFDDLSSFTVMKVIQAFERYSCPTFERLTLRGKANFIADVFNDACYSTGDGSVGSFNGVDVKTEHNYRRAAKRIIREQLIAIGQPNAPLHHLVFKASHRLKIPELVMADLRSAKARQEFNFIV